MIKMLKKIKINDQYIGEGESTFIIAEAGVNHNGKMDLAKMLVDVAKDAGVDAVKFQTFKSEQLVSSSVEMAEYQKENTGKQETQLEMLKRLELSYDNFKELKDYCDKKKIMFLSTPHTSDAVDFLELLVPAYKIGSGDLNNLPFLKKIASKAKPIILSTGMSNLEEVKGAVKTIKQTGNEEIILLHCTTNYPCPFEEVNLKAMLTLANEFSDLPCGYSDHTLGITVPIMAVALGAKVIEKHFTLDKTLSGPDHKASLNPDELKQMVIAIRGVEKAFGDGIKRPNPSEEKILEVARKSIISKANIPKGAKITEEMLVIKRPGTGIQPKYLDKVINKRAKKDIKKDTLISIEDLK